MMHYFKMFFSILLQGLTNLRKTVIILGWQSFYLIWWVILQCYLYLYYTVSDDRIIDEFEGIWKDVVMA
jgi:hypothetical protein